MGIVTISQLLPATDDAEPHLLASENFIFGSGAQAQVRMKVMCAELVHQVRMKVTCAELVHHVRMKVICSPVDRPSFLDFPSKENSLKQGLSTCFRERQIQVANFMKNPGWKRGKEPLQLEGNEGHVRKGAGLPANART